MCINFRERGREREGEKRWCERNISQLPPVHTLTGDQTYSLGMCFDQESNLQPFGEQDNAPTNWATWPRQ